MDDVELRLRCLELAKGNFDSAQRLIAFVKGIGVPADAAYLTKGEQAELKKFRDSPESAWACNGPEQPEEQWLVDLKSGDEPAVLLEDLSPGEIIALRQRLQQKPAHDDKSAA